MSDDILTQIDETVAEATSCFCGCSRAITQGSDSPWFASEMCQTRWAGQQIGAVVQEPAAFPPIAQLHHRESRPSAASPWLTREDVTGRPDRVAKVFRDEVRRQGIDERTIRIEALRPFLGPAVDAEMARLQAQVDRLETLSLECGMGNPLCSGCDGLNRNNGRCLHDCHEAEAEPWQPLLGRLDVPDIATRRPWWKRLWK